VREYQEASAAVPMSLPPATPSPGLKSRVLAAATGQAKPRPAILTRIFWSAAAVLLFAFLIVSLCNPPEYDSSMTLTGTKDAPAAHGRISWKDNAVKVEMSGLPALPAGKEYQLWQIGPEKAPIRQRTFRLDSRGALAGTDWMKYAVAKGQTFALTVEPAGGSRTPTMPIFFVATVN
jgi:anti-sigma-K factor RskA